MKVLWLSNVLFPDVCVELNCPIPVIGGWMSAGAQSIMKINTNIDLAVASLHSCKKLNIIEKNNITYYLIPNKGGNQKYNSKLEFYYKEIVDIFRPDIVHIHGTECTNSLDFVKACGNKNVVVSIQGLVSVYSKYYLGGIQKSEVLLSRTLRDLLRRDSLLIQQKEMFERGKYERELLNLVEHIVGRTSWDKSNVWAVNPQAHYYECNETLRSLFYKYQWTYEKCKKNRIFLSQAHYPIKGIQQLIKALPLILRHFPDTMVYVAGNDFMNKPWFKKNGFAAYLEKLMKKLDVRHKIVFCGLLDESEMVEQYLSANVFVCPSIIENSPNSVGEAQLVGTPCVASYVGGTMDMITEGKTGFLYRFEETALLAKRVCEIFANNELADHISTNGRLAALTRHNKQQNAINLNNIYYKIFNDNKSNI